MAALVTNTIDRAVITPTAAGVPDSSVTITSPRAGYIYKVIVGGTATTITVNRYGTNPAGDAEVDWSSGSLTNTTRYIPIGNGEFINPATGNAVVDFSQTTGVTAELLVVSV